MQSQMDLYEEMGALSSEMAAAARTNDWDRLVVLERSVAALRDTLMTLDDAALKGDDFARKATLIQQILDNDAEVRRHTEPWMEHARQFLGSQSRRRQVESAYHAGGGSLGGAVG